MGKTTTHTHPIQVIYTVQQIGLAILLVLMLLAALALMIVGVLLPAPLFFIVSGLVLLLASPVIMGIVNTPPVTIHDDGLTIHPMIGNERHILWHEIQAIVPYPLLPQADQEILKQYLIGRTKYQAAEGLMLVIPSLPLPYRIAGVLAGEKGAPVIAFTNRAHTDYDTLVQRMSQYAAPVIHEDYASEE